MSGQSDARARLTLDNFRKAVHDLLGIDDYAEISHIGDYPEFSAFNLRFGDHTLENVYQSSKIVNGTNHPELLEVSQGKAKRIAKSSGICTGFYFEGKEYGPEYRKSFVYDYIYGKALQDSGAKLPDENCFGDIFFNPFKSYSCQARSIALYKLAVEMGCSDIYQDIDKFKEWHDAHYPSASHVLDADGKIVLEFKL
jgi:hypothetical protein